MMPLIRGPTMFDSVTTTATSVATSAARSGMSYQRLVTSGILATRKRCASGRQIANTITLSRMPAASDHSTALTTNATANHAPRAPARQTDGTESLHQEDERHRHQHARGIHRHACERALRDERIVVVQREEDVGWPARDRQRRDQRADRGPRALGDHRGDHDEGGRDRHAQCEREDEGEFGGHCQVGTEPGLPPPLRGRVGRGSSCATMRITRDSHSLASRVSPAQRVRREHSGVRRLCSFTSTGGPCLMV